MLLCLTTGDTNGRRTFVEAWAASTPRRARLEDAGPLTQLFTRAFLNDPVMDWLARSGPKRAQELRHFSSDFALAHTTSRPQTVQGRGGGAGQQDGAHRLGIAGQGRHLSGACACGSNVRSSAAMAG